MDIKFHRNVFVDIFSLIFDIILISASVFASCYLTGIVQLKVAVIYVISIIFLLNIYEIYSKVIRRRYEILVSVVISTMLALLISVMVQAIFVSRMGKIHVLFFTLLWFLSTSFLCAWKLLTLKLVRFIEGAPKLLVIESNEVENDLARKVKYSYAIVYEAWYLMIDVNDEAQTNDIINNKYKEYDSVFVSPSIPDGLRERLVSKAINMGKEIYVLPDLYNISTFKSEVVQFDDTPALRIKHFGLTRAQRLIKRIMDISISLLAILVFSPFMLICAIFIKLDSKGPVIYKQERLTKYRKKFKIYKFRTMINNAEKETGAVLAVDNDPRITRIGRILRLLRLDELPQLFNILFGSMSIVGPRPEREQFVDEFIASIENYEKRFFVKAGLTGQAQVYARYNTRAEDKTLYDLLYIRDYSIKLDIKLILLTLKTMFMKERAKGVGTQQYNVAQNNHNETDASMRVEH